MCLLALARLATGPQPLLSLDLAQRSAHKLLPSAIRGTKSNWKPQDISNAMYALGELRIPATDSQLGQLLRVLVQAAPRWCAVSGSLNVEQVAYGCVQLGHRDEALMQQLLQTALRILQQRTAAGSRRPSFANVDSLAAICCW